MLVRRIALASLFLAVAPQLRAQPRLGPADHRELPPTDIERVAVGAPAPDFTLARYGGGTVTLSQFRGQKNVVLVFYRGYWCPFCMKQLGELRTLLDADLKRGTELVAVSVDGEKETRMTLVRVAQSGGAEPDFTFLMDPDHAVIDRYGILNPNGGVHPGIPHPATYVIDKSGVVRWRDVETDYTIRPTNEAILTGLRAIK